jgi:hypothetical protein
MKKVPFIVLAILVVLTFAGCKKKSVSGFKVENFSNGKAGEIILVMDNHFFSESEKKLIEEVLQQPQPAINQIEPMFDILNFSSKDFNSFFQKHRNIVHFDINSTYPNNHINFKKNVWSNPQTYIHIKGNSVDSCLSLFLANEEEIIHLLYENDLKRLQTFYLKNNEPNIEKLIKEKFGVTMSIPQHYFIANEETDFLWLRFRTSRNDRFIMIYKTPKGELTEKSAIKNRNFITQKHIPGAIKGSYPIIAEKNGFPISNLIQVNSKNGIELRGLWESVGDHMGGPFYSFSFLDSKSENIITLDGFVYAPEEHKRDYLREVEAIVKSIR